MPTIMANKAKIKVYGRFNNKDEATITIDRDLSLFIVRPKNFKTTYELPLSAVANMVIYNVISADIQEKKKIKRKKL